MNAFDKPARVAPENVKQRPAMAPRVDVYENERDLVVVADLPGVDRKDLSISVDKDELTIEAQRAEPDGRGSPLAREYRVVDFRRTFVLPGGIDREHIDAELSGGVLRLKLPKLDALRPRRIEVRSG